MRTRVFRVLPVAALLGVGSCASHLHVSPAEVTPRTELRIRFEQPRTLRFHALDGGVLPVAEVVELQGRMIAGTADSIRIGASSVRVSGGDVQRFGSGTVTTIALSGSRLEQVQRHTGRTIALVGVLILGAAILIAIATYQEPPPPPPPEPKPKA